MSFYSEYSARTPGSGSGGSGVSSLNSLTGALTLAAGTGISITPSGGNTLTIATTGGGSGTVTSVDMTVPAFLAISGNPITTSGTLALTLSGTALPVANGGTGAITFTQGSVPFMGASALTEDNSNLFWDDSSNTLKLGTNPGAALFGLTVQRSDTDQNNQAGAIYARHDNFLTTTNPNLSSAGSFDAHFQADTGVSSSGGAAVLFNAFRDQSSDMGTLSFLVGAFGGATQETTDSTATTGLLAGILAQVNVNSGTATTVADFYGLGGNLSGGTIVNQFGVYIAPSNVGSKNNFLTGQTQLGGSSSSTFADASLELKATDKALLLNRVDSATETGLTAVNGMQLYNSDTNKFRAYENGAWVDMIGGSSGANIHLSNLSAVAINSDLFLDTDNAYQIGDAMKAAKYVYTYGILSPLATLTLESDAGAVEVYAFDEHFNIYSYNGSIAPSLNLWDKDQNFSSWVKAPDTLAADTLFQLPPDNGTNGNALITDGSGNTSWSPSINLASKELYNTTGEVKVSWESANTLIQSNLAGTLASGDMTVTSFASTAAGGTSGQAIVATGNADLATGNASMYTGDSAGANTGHVLLYSGAVASDASNSGSMQFTSGGLTSATAAGTTGDLNIASGENAGLGNSGPVFIGSGNAVGGDSGSISLTVGPAGVTRGDINLDAATIVLTASQVVFPPASADPTGIQGGVYFNTMLSKLKVFNGVTWETITSA